jgi:cytochrome c oxidase cbb3-type subunit III
VHSEGVSCHIAFLLALHVLLLGACRSGSATPEPESKREARPAAPRDTAGSKASDGSAGGAGGLPRGMTADVRGLAGKPIYLALCAQCHGADGKGYAADRAPSLVNPTFLESASDEFLRRSILAGRPGTSMAGYGAALGGPLDDAAVDRLVSYLREQGPAALPLPAPRAGNPGVGAAIYARHCLACHGNATIRGEAVSLTNPEFQAAASDAFVRHAIARGRPGTKMEAFAGKLTDAEIDGVVSYLRTLGRKAPPAALLPEPTGKEPIVLHPSGRHPSFTLRATTCPPSAPGCKPDPRFVSVEQVGKAMTARQRMVIVDARPVSDWRRARIAGAVSIPYHDLKRLDELPKDAWIIAYCGCPHHLSGIVVDELRKRGHKRAVVLDEGVNEWHRRGLPMVTAEGVTRPLPEPRSTKTFD